MVDAAVKQIGADPDLGRRALEHFAQELVSGQCNREAVTKLALEYLAHDPPEETPKARHPMTGLTFSQRMRSALPEIGCGSTGPLS
jgi:hypothetical protein